VVFPCFPLPSLYLIMAAATMTTPVQLDELSSQGERSHRISLSSEETRNNVMADDQAPLNAAEAIPDGGYGWTVVSACALILFWINGYSTTWGVLQAALLQSSQLKVDVRTITFVGSLTMALLVGFGPFAVRLMSSFDTRYTCMVAIFAYSLGLVLTSFTLNNIGGLFATAGILMGISASVVYTATNSMPIQYFSGKLGLANGLVKAGGGLGATLMPVASQALIDKVGLAWTFRILGSAILLTGLPAAYLLKERVPAAQLSRFDFSLLKDPSFMTLALAGAVGVFALFVPPFFLPLFANSIGLPASTGAGLVAGFGAATTLGRLLTGWFCDRIGAFNALAITVLINSLSMWAIWPVSSSLAPLLIFAVVNGCANGGLFVALLTAVAALTPSSATSSVALATFFWTPGYLLGSPIAGMLIQMTGAADSKSIQPYRAAIFYAAGTGLLATALVVLVRMRLEPKLLKKL
jgi:MFS family permease